MTRGKRGDKPHIGAAKDFHGIEPSVRLTDHALTGLVEVLRIDPATTDSQLVADFNAGIIAEPDEQVVRLAPDTPIVEVLRAWLESIASEYHGPGGLGGDGRLGMRWALDEAPRPSDQRKALFEIASWAGNLAEVLDSLDTSTRALLREHSFPSLNPPPEGAEAIPAEELSPDEVTPWGEGIEPWPEFKIEADKVSYIAAATRGAAFRAIDSLAGQESRGRARDRAIVLVIGRLAKLFDHCYSGREHFGRRDLRAKYRLEFLECHRPP